MRSRTLKSKVGDLGATGPEGRVEGEGESSRREGVAIEAGLLWYDDSPTDLSVKVEAAAQRYCEKFGRRPDRCYVNPASLPGDEGACSLNGIKVMSIPSVLPNHFWVGVHARRRSQKTR